MHEGESEAGLILEPFDFVCVCVLSARMSCRLQSMKGFLCAVWIPVRGLRTRLHQRGAVLWGGISSSSAVAESGAGGQGGSMSQSLPAPGPLGQDTAKAE